MEIKKLQKLAVNSSLNWGHNGYTTDRIYSVSSIEYAGSFEFTIREKSLSYTKVWETGSEDIDELNLLIEKGQSFGAYHKDELVGWIICEQRTWNNSFYIENILIDEKYRRQGIGIMLIKNAIKEARRLNCRVIELETQNTNYPAIQFYRRMGFNITGLNTRLYENSEEIALFMTLDIE
ncbi:N-acetyltransferase [Chryseobacterium lactis]|uniref:N-acetyltransferase n=1 Tax=Chryseobacterium lactis TaxID=1241981 RepID=A0A3G6RLX1_CHRLC|nr:GNAT family N-acetyltransferase [Chryseobacterium lactis]AZA84890.1 GNAT family N-acetyltransferase [Chryseobacterium lactis]AZB05278.1 GNAT family N-acetyltransferase [Chryseobacterium lactis]PNW12261.1 N-acetyltransferase [Chryseobacterium lactis]